MSASVPYQDRYVLRRALRIALEDLENDFKFFHDEHHRGGPMKYDFEICDYIACLSARLHLEAARKALEELWDVFRY